MFQKWRVTKFQSHATYLAGDQVTAAPICNLPPTPQTYWNIAISNATTCSYWLLCKIYHKCSHEKKCTYPWTNWQIWGHSSSSLILLILVEMVLTIWIAMLILVDNFLIKAWIASILCTSAPLSSRCLNSRHFLSYNTRISSSVCTQNISMINIK